MSSMLADPALFSAFAIAAGEDPDLVKGTHVRLLPSSFLGFPLAPFLLWQMQPKIADLPVHWNDRAGHVFGHANLVDAHGELYGTLLGAPPDEGRVIGVQAVPDGEGAVGGISLLDQVAEVDRVIVARSASRFTVGAPKISRLRLVGNGPLETLHCYYATPDQILEALLGAGLPFPEDRILSLPINQGMAPWYADSHGSEPALRRVHDGAPRRWTPPDRPDGPFDPLPADAEMARLEGFRSDVDDRLLSILVDAGTPPWTVSESKIWPANVPKLQPWQKADIKWQDVLLLQAMDPGLARYLGLMTRIDDLPSGLHPMIWAASGVFAVDRRRLTRGSLLDQDDLERRFLARIFEILPGARHLGDEVKARGFEVRALVALAIGAPPPDPPPPVVAIGAASWRREKETLSTRYRQTFILDNPPLAALSAIGRLEGGGWVSRHVPVDLPPGSDPPRRVAPMLLARRQRRTDENESVPLFYGLVTDEDIPAEGAPWRYRLRLGDLFGRYGEPSEIAAPAPPRPKPPRPAMQTRLHPNLPAAGEDASAFGKLEVTVPVPPPIDLGAGARAIVEVEVRLDGASHSAAPDADGVARFMLDLLPALKLFETHAFTVEARFKDEAGEMTPDPPASTRIEVADPRAPTIVRSGPAILWTSRPGPAEEVELRLVFPGQPGGLYRAYLADAAGLEPEMVTPTRTRAEIAVDGALRARDGLLNGRRDRFRLLTEPPLHVDAPEPVTLVEKLPRALQTVQFLRIVPMSQNGVEADFDRCGLVPVAVPFDRRPPAPLVKAEIAPDTGIVTVTVEAVGMDRDQLRRAEPKLFEDPGAADVRRPEFRLRRTGGFEVPGAAATEAPSPLYAREIGRSEMRVETGGDGPRVIGTFVDASRPLLPFVRYAYWAEVRMPPERRLPAGVPEEPSDVKPADPSEARDLPGAFSLTSPTIMRMRVPEAPPAIEPGSASASLIVDQNAHTYVASFELQNGPTLSPRAIGPYLLKLWTQEGDQPITSTGSPIAVTSDGRATWKGAATPYAGVAPSAVTLRAALVDPLGRTGPILEVPVAPA